ncbi:MAG: tetratricopeptide repeat protein [Alphaproteobacteria bacterium]|jgi:tetratricopeptide (TPR) repeat protein|nr:tetratricopeptide repeat protein [Alphaproteobacteria bacterium]
MTGPVPIARLFADAWAHHDAGRLDQALECYAEILERAPSHTAALVHVAELYWRHGREDDARLIWNRVLEEEETNILGAMAGLARPFMVLAAICLESERSGLANRLLEAAVEHWPGQSEVHEFLALRRHEIGDVEAAEAHFERAAALAPERVEAWFNLSAARAGSGDVVGALAALDQILDIDPLYNQTLQQVIALIERLDDDVAAEHYLERLHQVADEDNDVLAYVGFRFMEVGRYEGALSAFAQVVDADLGSYQALFGAAAAANRLGEAAAAEYGRQGLASLPEDLEARLTVVSTFHQDLPTEVTAEVLETAIEAAWSDRAGLERIREVAHELGWEAAAIRSRRRLEALAKK